jgi:SulP family sulfate permease
VTGTIARTATNLRAGSRGPVSGMLHALFVLLAMLVAAPLAGHIPLAALAGLLAVVAWNMAEKEELWSLIRHSGADAVVVLVTFLLVVFVDLTTGIVVGFALGGLVFIQRMSDAAGVVEAPEHGVEGDAGMLVYHMSGPYFFGAAAQLGSVLDRIADHPRLLVVDFADVPFIDSTGARSFALLARKTARAGGQLCLTGTRPEVRRALHAGGVHAPAVQFRPDVASVPRGSV